MRRALARGLGGGALLTIAITVATCAGQPMERPGEDQYWLWILGFGEAHSTEPYRNLEACRHAKEFWTPPGGVGVQVARCLTVSPFGRGPFFMYFNDGSAFDRVTGTPAFSSLDECDVARRPWVGQQIAVTCAPSALEEPL